VNLDERGGISIVARPLRWWTWAFLPLCVRISHEKPQLKMQKTVELEISRLWVLMLIKKKGVFKTHFSGI